MYNHYMYILPRYIIRQHVGPFLFGFFVITLLWILNIVFTRLGHLLSRGLPISIILEFFLLNMAWIVALALPMAVLMSTLMAFGRMAADLEVTAMKASGINFYRMLFPVLFIGIILCIFLIWFNNSVLPEVNHKYVQLARDIQRKRPTISFEPGVMFRDIPKMHLMMQTVDEHENRSYVTGVLIYDRSDKNKQKTIIAEKGDIFVDESSGIFEITLYDGEIHETPTYELAQYTRIHFPKQVFRFQIDDMILKRQNSNYRGDSEQNAQVMLKTIRENDTEINKKEDELNNLILPHIQTYFPFVEIPDDLNAAQKPEPEIYRKPSSRKMTREGNIRKLIRIHKKLSQRARHTAQMNHIHELTNLRLWVEVHKKYSIPVACIVFVLIGAPLGVMARQGGMAVGGAISLIFFLIYWAFLIGGEELAKRDYLSPFFAMWLANILVGSMGIYLVIHTVRELTVIRFDFMRRIFRK